MIIQGKFSLVLHKNICCGYSLQSSHQVHSNEFCLFVLRFYVPVNS